MHQPAVSYCIAKNLQIIFTYWSNPSAEANSFWVEPITPDSAARNGLNYHGYEAMG